MGQKYVLNPQLMLVRVLDVAFDIALRIDHSSHTRRLVPDEVRRVGQTVEVELPEDHRLPSPRGAREYQDRTGRRERPGIRGAGDLGSSPNVRSNEGGTMREEIRRIAAAGMLVAALVAVLVTVPCLAASIPSWLDDGISKWNTANPQSPIRFVDIKDSYVWYDLPRTADMGHAQIRERLNKIVMDHGYKPMDDEEMVTTGKPPVTSGRVMAKKCWSRSFVLNLTAQADTKAVGDASPGQRQRMLTSLVCEDSKTWWAAFRVAE
jgi:hypothetical protein